jgi:hypothetical protein
MKYVKTENIPDEWKDGRPVLFCFWNFYPYKDWPERYQDHYHVGVFIKDAEYEESDLECWSFEEEYVWAEDAYWAAEIKRTERPEWLL